VVPTFLLPPRCSRFPSRRAKKDSLFPCRWWMCCESQFRFSFRSISCFSQLFCCVLRSPLHVHLSDRFFGPPCYFSNMGLSPWKFFDTHFLSRTRAPCLVVPSFLSKIRGPEMELIATSYPGARFSPVLFVLTFSPNVSAAQVVSVWGAPPSWPPRYDTGSFFLPTEEKSSSSPRDQAVPECNPPGKSLQPARKD